MKTTYLITEEQTNQLRAIGKTAAPVSVGRAGVLPPPDTYLLYRIVAARDGYFEWRDKHERYFWDHKESKWAANTCPTTGTYFDAEEVRSNPPLVDPPLWYVFTDSEGYKEWRSNDDVYWWNPIGQCWYTHASSSARAYANGHGTEINMRSVPTKTPPNPTPNVQSGPGLTNNDDRVVAMAYGMSVQKYADRLSQMADARHMLVPVERWVGVDLSHVELRMMSFDRLEAENARLKKHASILEQSNMKLIRTNDALASRLASALSALDKARTTLSEACHDRNKYLSRLADAQTKLSRIQQRAK